MDERPELPNNPIERPAYSTVSYCNLDVENWYFVVLEAEERLCQVTELYRTGDDDWVRVRVYSIRSHENGNYGDWIDDEDSLSFNREDDLEDEDTPLQFYKLADSI